MKFSLVKPVFEKKKLLLFCACITSNPHKLKDMFTLLEKCSAILCKYGLPINRNSHFHLHCRILRWHYMLCGINLELSNADWMHFVAAIYWKNIATHNMFLCDSWCDDAY